MSLTRNGKGSNVLGNYTFHYTGNTNKLASVTGGANTVSYSYDSIGRMTQQVEGTNTMNVSYNAYGLVKEVRNGSNALLETYRYDDRGDLVKKSNYNGAGTLLKTTWYVRDASGNPLAIYETIGGTTALAERPVFGAGRIGMMKVKSGSQKYFYEVTDHLGNVRAVIGDPTTEAPVATYETANANGEHTNFLRYDNARKVSSYLFNHTGGGGVFAERLNGSANEKYGIARSLSVMPGDTVKLEVYAKYVDTNSANWTAALNTLMGQIAGGASGVVVDGTGYSTSTSSFGFGGLINTTGSTGGPKAYLNWLIFDRNYALINGGYVRLSSAPKEYGQNVAHERLATSFTVNEPSYVYTYLSNEEPTGSPIDVYFDDFKVTQVHGSIVAGGDYYPFGLPMDTRQMSLESYRYGYQGQFSEKDSLTNWNAFQLRMYDARFGRWISPDPKGQFASPYVVMGNEPVSGIDPDGGIYISPKLMEALNIMAETDAFPLPEVVVSAQRIFDASAIGLDLRWVITETDRKLVAFMGGVGDAALNNATLGASEMKDPSTQAYAQQYADGQRAGHMISVAAGAGTTILGGIMAGGGYVLRGSGGAALLSIPASRAGYALMGLGVSVSLHALQNLNKVHHLNSEGSNGGGWDRVTFGENSNQQYHTFRHIEEAGLDKSKVERAIREDIKKILDSMESGKSYNVQITVDGKSITYSAYKRPNGIVNVGRIVVN